MSGAAKRRRRRIRSLRAEHESIEQRFYGGGDVIDGATTALRAVVMLACGNQRPEASGNELATLLDLICEELLVGRAVQQGEDNVLGPE